MVRDAFYTRIYHFNGTNSAHDLIKRLHLIQWKMCALSKFHFGFGVARLVASHRKISKNYDVHKYDCVDSHRLVY